MIRFSFKLYKLCAAVALFCSPSAGWSSQQEKPLISHINHITLCINNLQQARWFYGDILGLDEMTRPEGLDHAGVWYQLGDISLRLIVSPTRPSDSPEHVALWASDIYRTAQALEDAGFLTHWDNFSAAGTDCISLRDPSGNFIKVLGVDHSP